MSDNTSVNFVNIPQKLKASCSFCVWKREKRDGRLTKVPYDPRTGKMARTNAPDTFSDFGTAVKAYVMGGYDGIGFRVSEGIGAIDIDHCIREDGSLNDVAASVLGIFKDSYFERSPSGTGLRGFFILSPDFIYDKTVYYINNRKHGLEVYLPGTTNRFVTVTGDIYRPGEVSLDMEALTSVLNTFMKRSSQVQNIAIEPCSYLTDEQVIEHAKRSKSGEKFQALYDGHWEELYNSQSEADMAFISMLAFWCGCVEEQIDRLFRNSGLMRPKWDRMSGDATYGQITIRNAVASAKSIYLPVNAADVADMEFDDLEVDGEEKHPDFTPDLSRLTLTLEQMQPHVNHRYGLGEIGLGNAFSDFFKPIARFNRDRKIWYVYDGIVWRPDKESLAVSEMAKLLADKLYAYALQIKDEDARKRYIDRVRPLQFRKNRRTMVEDAKSVFPVSQEIFDRNIELFNCKNGTLDLRTLEFRPHDPKDYLTMASGVSYDPDAVCPRWERFISEVMRGDAALSSYLQKALGYALSGDTSLECLFILYGPTSRNGKGTMMETFLRIMGDYGVASNPELLETKFGASNSSGPSEEIARLAGIRFVNIPEPGKKLTFNAALVKRMTGNDTLNARFLHENSFDFRPVFKIFINTNHLPNVSDMTLFDSGRLKIIPFTRRFEESEQDHGLKAFFASEDNLAGIFNWCLKGHRRYREEGLRMPEAVKEATAGYKEESDRVGQFVRAWLEVGEAYEVRASAAYKLYSTWCEKYGYHRENVKNFNSALSRYFSLKRKRPSDGDGSTTTMFMGCRFLEHENGEETADGDFEEIPEATEKSLCPF